MKLYQESVLKILWMKCTRLWREKWMQRGGLGGGMWLAVTVSEGGWLVTTNKEEERKIKTNTKLPSVKLPWAWTVLKSTHKVWLVCFLLTFRRCFPLCVAGQHFNNIITIERELCSVLTGQVVVFTVSKFKQKEVGGGKTLFFSIVWVQMAEGDLWVNQSASPGNPPENPFKHLPKQVTFFLND